MTEEKTQEEINEEEDIKRRQSARLQMQVLMREAQLKKDRKKNIKMSKPFGKPRKCSRQFLRAQQKKG